MQKTTSILILLTFLVMKSFGQNATCIYTPYFKTFIPPLTPSLGGNTVQNNDFENNNLSSWTLLPNSTRIVNSSSGNNSNYSAKLISTNNAGGDTYMNQTIPNLIPGNTYSLSAWLKSNLATNNKVLSTDLNVRLNYPNGSYTVLSKSCFPTNVWTKYTNTFTVPSNINLLQSIVQIYVYRGQNDSVLVDNIELNVPASNFGFMNTTNPQAPTGNFVENFTGPAGSQLSLTKWLVVKKAWGNYYVANNNGVVPENLELLCNGGMRFHGHGDTYNGPITGVGGAYGNGKSRTGACIATKDYYASGKYEVVAKLTPGMINAFWTFHYIEDPAYQNGGMKNTEIDWEFPSNNYYGSKNVINDGLCNTWGGLCDGTGLTTSGISHSQLLNIADASQDFHTYTIEWHTGGNGINPSISWFIDSVLIKQETNPTYIPFRASRFWVGVWYGNNNWMTGGNSAIMQYSDKYMEVKSVKITPYYEANDIYETETDPTIGFVGPIYYPTFPCTSTANNRMINKNTSSNSNTISASEISDYIELYPNPAQNEVYLNLKIDNETISELEITDISGRQIKKYSYINQSVKNIQFNIEDDLNQGYYFIKGKTNSGKTFMKKLLISK